MQQCLLVRTLFLGGLTFLKIYIIMSNFQFFSLGENFLLSKHLEAHTRQMQLGMRSFQAWQVQTSLSSCDMSFNNTVFPIYSCQF